MTALKVIGIILLIFLLTGFLRIGAIVSFGDELRVKARVGPVKVTVPMKKEKKKAEKGEKTKEKKSEEETPGKKRDLPKLTLGEIIDLAETALSALGATIRRICRRLRIDPLDATVAFGGCDPANVARTYGAANAAMWRIMPKAEELFYIPDPSLHLRVDFDAGGTAAKGSVGVSLRVCDLFAIAFTLAVPLGKWLLRWKKAHQGDKTAHKGAADKANDIEEKTQEQIA